MEDKNVKLVIELTEQEAYYFALFLKRTSWSTFEEHSDRTEQETQRIADAVCAVQREFGREGFAPR